MEHTQKSLLIVLSFSANLHEVLIGRMAHTFHPDGSTQTLRALDGGPTAGAAPHPSPRAVCHPGIPSALLNRNGISSQESAIFYFYLFMC